MNSIERLIEDWIAIRTTLKGQLKQFEDGDHMLIGGQNNDQVTAKAKEHVHRCIVEIELLIKHYSSMT